MWLLTTLGFFSVVAHRDDPDLLTIRARVRTDLEALRDHHLPDIDILESVDTDYRFRAFVPRPDFERAATELAAEIDYPNFKSAIAERQGHDRAGVYSEVWSTLYTLQRSR